MDLSCTPELVQSNGPRSSRIFVEETISYLTRTRSGSFVDRRRPCAQTKANEPTSVLFTLASPPAAEELDE